MTKPTPAASRRRNTDTRAANAARKLKALERRADALRAEGYDVFRRDASPVPTEPGLYVSDTLWRNANVRAAGPAALGMWHLMLVSNRRTVVDGMVAIPRTVVAEHRLGELSEPLVRHNLWAYHHRTDSWLFLHPGALYTLIGDDGTNLTPAREED